MAVPMGRLDTTSALAWLAIAAIASGLAANAYFQNDFLTLSLCLALPIIPLALYGFVRAAHGEERSFLLAVLVLIVIQTGNFRYRAIDDKSIDWQVALKLLALGALALSSLPATMAVLKGRCKSSAMLWFLFLVFLAGTALYSVDPPYTLISAASLLVALLVLLSIQQIYGSVAVFDTLLGTAFVLCLMSTLAYVALPELGRMYDWENGSFVMTDRMQGILGSANATGATAATGLILLATSRSVPIPAKCVAAAIFLVCLIASDNRMAIACVSLAFALFLFLRSQYRPALVAAGLLIFGLFLLIFSLAGDDLLAAVSRSGSAEEVKNATGRSVIWQTVLDLWSAQPLFGYGFTSSQRILPEQPALFTAAAHAHNLYLEILFAGGLYGLILFAAACAATVQQACEKRADPTVIALLAFSFVYGLTEPIISSVAGFPAFALFAAVAAVEGGGDPALTRT